MRRFILAATAVAALAGAALSGNRAEAVPLPGRLADAAATAEQVYLRCTRVWNGWRWVRSCVEVGPRYYGYGPGYYGPGYGYYGGWRPRPRYYGYY